MTEHIANSEIRSTCYEIRSERMLFRANHHEEEHGTALFGAYI
jgi:hypothetical protein